MKGVMKTPYQREVINIELKLFLKEMVILYFKKAQLNENNYLNVPVLHFFLEVGGKGQIE